jgi:hypothetical protein
MSHNGPRTKKLTLWIEEELIEKAKAYGKRHNKSVSELVSDYFRVLDGGVKMSLEDLPPIVKRLMGSLGSDVSIDDYKKHLEEKYLGNDTKNEPKEKK